LVEVICPKRYNNKCVLLEPIPTFQFRLFAMARSLSYCDNGKSICKVFNYSPKTLVLRKGIQIASAVSSSVISSLTPFRSDNEPLEQKIEDKQSSETLESFASDYGFKINPELTSLQRFELLQLLFEYKDVFARSLAEIRQYDGYELSLDLLSTRPVYKRQYRLRPEEAVEAQTQIDEMAECGVIEPSDSVCYNSPLFTVAKKTG